jgi:hypothetical protein
MDSQNMAYVYNGIFFYLKKEENSDICYNMDKPSEHYNNLKNSHKDECCMISLV